MASKINAGVRLGLTKLYCTPAMEESIIECLKGYKNLSQFRLRWPAVDSVKRGNSFVIRKLDKVASAGKVTFLLGTTFFHIHGAMICITVPLF